MRNCYKVLGIASTADDRRIKSAFRRRAKKVHPDLNPHKKRAEERFIELVQAYEVLSDAETRTAYDAYLAQRRSQARRRFAHCAGLMAASFMVTAASALLVLGLAGAHIPYRATWQVAVAAMSQTQPPPTAAAQQGGTGWTTQVTAARVRASPAASPDPGSAANPAPPAATQPAAVRRPQIARGTTATQQRRQVATAPSPASPPAIQPARDAQENWWPWSNAAEEQPRYSLGASGLR